MTRKLFDVMYAELVAGMAKVLTQEAAHLLASGGVDLAAAEDTYALPKTVLSAALARQAYAYGPLSPEGKRQYKNLVKM